jgi:hypothetical protein
MQQWLLAPSTMIYLAALDNHRSIVFKSISLQLQDRLLAHSCNCYFQKI